MAASDIQSPKQKPYTNANLQHHRSSRHLDFSTPKPSRRLHKEDESVIPIASRTRRRSQLEVIEVSDAPIVKLEPTSDMEMDVPSPDLPGPSQVTSVFLMYPHIWCSKVSEHACQQASVLLKYPHIWFNRVNEHACTNGYQQVCRCHHSFCLIPDLVWVV